MPNINNEDDDEDFASVRFHVQQGSENQIADDVKVNTKKKSVTKKQGYSALGEIYAEAIQEGPSLAHK